ncbi:MAG: hypothetical protein J0L75_21640, partial [Spirochaetes bacterium]|nr:hypothetical protein [Spirochaetota bacterium]
MKRSLQLALISLLTVASLFPDSPPSMPMLLAPASNVAFTNTNFVTVSWSASTDDIQLSNYTVFWYTNGVVAASNAVATNVLSTNFSFPGSVGYFVQWSVFARDNSNQISSFAMRPFGVSNADLTPPSAAVPIGPTNGALLTNVTGQFNWQPATDNIGVTKYVVSLLTNGGLWRNLSNVSGTNVATNLIGAWSNTSMGWYVRAYDAA